MVAFSDTASDALSDGVDLLGAPPAPYMGAGVGVQVGIQVVGSAVVDVVVFVGAVAFVVVFWVCIVGFT